MANVRNARWVGAQLSDLFLAARGDDQSVASAHLAPEEESSALVGCVPQSPAQAFISISTNTATHHHILPVQIITFVVIEEHCV